MTACWSPGTVREWCGNGAGRRAPAGGRKRVRFFAFRYGRRASQRGPAAHPRNSMAWNCGRAGTMCGTVQWRSDRVGPGRTGSDVAGEGSRRSRGTERDREGRSGTRVRGISRFRPAKPPLNFVPGKNNGSYIEHRRDGPAGQAASARRQTVRIKGPAARWPGSPPAPSPWPPAPPAPSRGRSAR